MTTNYQENKKGGSKRGLIIAFIIILLGINGVQLWLNLSKTEEIQKKDLTITEQKSEISTKTIELDKVIRELEQKKAELAQLGADTATLAGEILKLKKERDSFAKEARLNKEKYEEMMARIDDAMRLKDRAEADVSYWKVIATRLDSTNRELKAIQEHFIDSLKKLNLSKEQLAEKVAIASVLKAENIRFEGINNKGKSKEDTEFRVKSLEKLRVRFQLGENKIAQVENKEIYLRVIEPSGSVLFDESMGGGLFEVDQKEIPYTLKTNILFDNKRPEVTFTYHKGNMYKLGKYTIELYSDGYSIGSGSFQVKK